MLLSQHTHTSKKFHSSNKELLFLCHRIPYPPNKGDKIRSYNILSQLKQCGWKIHLGSLCESPDELIYSNKLKQYCESISIVHHSKSKKLFCPIAIIKGTSLSVECFRNAQLQEYVDDVLASGTISAALIVSAPMAEYLRSSSGPLPPRRILDLVDVDSEKWRNYAKGASWPTSLIYRLEAKLHGHYERIAATLFQAVLLSTNAEASLFKSISGINENIIGLSNGVDLKYFAPVSSIYPTEPPRIVFCGAMDYPPNIDAVVWFSNSVLPIILRRLPKASFWIVGAKPTSRVLSLVSKPGVRVTGAVNDVRSYVAAAALSVAPIRLARGVQNKVLEAMAMGKAVLATPQAFEGIDAVPGQDLAVAADDPESFAQAALDLLLAPDAVAAMGVKARTCMEQHYCWVKRLAPLDALLR